MTTILMNMTFPLAYTNPERTRSNTHGVNFPMYGQINLPRITSTYFSASKISSTRNLPYRSSTRNSLVGSWSLALLGPHVTFVALSRGSFGDLFPALIMNEIYESENPSDIITPLQSSLAKTWKVNNIVSLFFPFLSQSLPSLHRAVPSFDLTSVDPMKNTFLMPVIQNLSPSLNTAVTLPPYLNLFSGKPWHFPLIAEVHEGVGTTRYKYNPTAICPSASGTYRSSFFKSASTNTLIDNLNLIVLASYFKQIVLFAFVTIYLADVIRT